MCCVDLRGDEKPYLLVGTRNNHGAETRVHYVLRCIPQVHLPRTTILFRFQEMQVLVQSAGDGLHDILQEVLNAQTANGTGPCCRLIEHVRYRKSFLLRKGSKITVHYVKEG